MTIPKNIRNRILCCISNDEHITKSAVLLKCKGNACKSCIESIEGFEVKCNYCNEEHNKDAMLNSPVNDDIRYIIDVHLKELHEELNNKLTDIKEKLNGEV